MEILILAHKLDAKSSIIRIFFRNAEEFIKLGHKVTIIFPHNFIIPEEHRLVESNNIFLPSVKIFSFLRGGINPLEIIYKTFFLIKYKFDVVYVYRGHRPASLIPVVFEKIFNNKTIFLEEWWEWYSGPGGLNSRRKGIFSVPIKIYDRLFELSSKKFYDGIICITSALYDRIPKIKNKIVLHGASELPDTKLNISISKSDLGFSEDDFIIGISNLKKDDHQDYLPLYQSLSKMISKGHKIKLLVTGDEEAISYLRSFVGNENIKNLGWVSYEKYISTFKLVNVIILPYPNEPRNIGRWPNKMGDYFLIGKPIITNSTGDIKKLFDNYKLGYLVKNIESEYIQILTKFINKRNINNHGNYDFDKVLSEFSFSRRISKIIDFIKNIKSKR